MKVPVVGSGVTQTGKTQVKKGVGGGFSSYLSVGDEAEAPSVSGVGTLSPVNSLFMLQEIEDEPESRKKAVKHGTTMLEYLDEIRIDLLTGEIPDSLLKRLDGLIKQWRDNIPDPKLDSIINEIELRAAVELAKRKII